MSFDFKRILPQLVSLVVIIVLSVVYFLPQFQGKVMVQTDTLSYKAIAKEAHDYQDKTGEPALWTDAIFGGMPTYQISSPQNNNYFKYVEQVLDLGIDRPAGYFIMGMIGFYFLLYLMGVGPWLSLIGALLFGFSTNNIILFDAGHMSKLRAIMTAPLMLAGMTLVFRKRYLLGGLLFTVFLSLHVYVNHLQMTYYLALVLGIWTIIEIVSAITKGETTHMAKMLAVFIFGSAVALAASSSRILTTIEYSAETVRGNAVLKKGEDRDQGGGMEWNRAMAWSNGTIDLLPSFIPMAAGGGGATMLDKDSALAKKLNRRQSFVAPMYHGDLTFTGGPIYFGAIAWFLFLFGAFSVRGKMKWWLVAGVVLTLLMSMGKNFPVISRVLFDYFPMFNKFRTPNSVLSITVLFIPILGILGLYNLIKEENKSKFLVPAYIALGLSAGLAVILALFGGAFIDFVHPRDNMDGDMLQALIADRKSMFSASAFRTAEFIVAAFAVMFFYMKGKMSQLIMIGLVGLLGLIDLWQVDKTYLGADKFQAPRRSESTLQARPIDQQILQDKDIHYRIHDLTVDPFNNAMAAYHHKLVGGYHPAKLQRYDDIIPYLATGNMAMLNMLNAKYIVVEGKNGQATAQRNPSANGAAWFVDEIKMAQDNNDEYAQIEKFDPAVSAIVHNEFSDYISGLNPQKNGSINISAYSPMKLVYNTNTSSEQLAVFSEVWYGPDLGWQAYIDGQPVDHIRANYLLRALKVPAGQHEIVFQFEPSTYYRSETMSLIASLLGLILLIATIFFWWKNKEENSLPTFEEVLDNPRT